MMGLTDDCKNAEINCICKISEIVATNNNFKYVIQRAAETIPSGFQYPSITCIRITVNNRTFKTSNFKITPWKISCSCTGPNSLFISIEAFYLEERPKADDGPFLSREKTMLISICNYLKTFYEREEALRAHYDSEQKCKAFMDNALDGMMVLDFKGKVLLFNTALAKMFEVDDPEASINHSILDYLCEEYKLKAIKDQLNVLRGKGGYLSTYKVRSRKGREFWVEGLGTKIIYNGNLANIVIIRDITERMAAEEKLKIYRQNINKLVKERIVNTSSSNEKLKENIKIWKHMNQVLSHEKNKLYKYLNSIGVIVIVLGPEGHVSFMNKKGSELLGYNKDGIVGQDWIEIFVPDHYRDHAKDIFLECLSGNCVNECEYPVLRYNGENRMILWTNVPLIDENQSVIGMISTGEDITDLRDSQETLQQYVDDLKKSNEFKMLFIDILRHDLLNPATIIKGYSEILLERIKMDEEKALVEKIYEQNENLIQIINTASTLGKLESIDMVSFEKIDLLDMLRKVCSGYVPLLKEKNMTVQYPAKDKCLADVNPMIKEAFSNLISNAIKFSPHGGKLVLDIEDLESSWKITFTDFGMGVSDENKDAIFRRFKQVSAEGTKGSGLGLAIVKKIIELHHGEVGIYDNPLGQGAVFWIELKKTQSV
ncbi:MAG: PAS domain S-box protein [Methanomethylovorans sp.]|uniref:sensor histidine kinase n=1 Tax=Methanomethylovorans sp. TaxID=2758717 RepID=UPI003C774E10